MTYFKIELAIEFTEEMADQILVTAFDGNYGGSLYWATVEDIKSHTVEGDVRWMGATVIDHDRERHFIDMDRLARGLKVYIERDMISDSHMAETVNGEATDFDANDADAIVQLAIWGTMMYG